MWTPIDITKVLVRLAIAVLGTWWLSVPFSAVAQTPTAESPIKIGITVPLTGDFAGYGEQIRRGV